LRTFSNQYRDKGYVCTFDYEPSSRKYALNMRKGITTIIIRDGFFNGKPDKSRVELTSFDVLFSLDKSIFAKYYSDYPLDEYLLRLDEAFELVDSFADGNYNLTSEKSLLGKEKQYLNIELDGQVEHLLGKSIR
jgi:hypothetical protein